MGLEPGQGLFWKDNEFPKIVIDPSKQSDRISYNRGTRWRYFLEREFESRGYGRAILLRV
jgi:hypothetical protein